MSRREERAQYESPGGWGEVGDARLTRYAKPITDGRRRRRRCPFQCPNRAGLVGMANGVALISGCEFHVAAWVRDGLAPLGGTVDPQECPVTMAVCTEADCRYACARLGESVDPQ